VLKHDRIAGDIFFIPVLLAEGGVEGLILAGQITFFKINLNFLYQKSKLTAQFIGAWSIL